MARRGFTRGATALLSLLILFAGACARPQPWSSPAAEQPADGGQASPASGPLRPSNAQIQEAYGRIPLHFEENRGQADARIRYLSRTRRGPVALTPNALLVGVQDRAVALEWVGARTPRITAEDALSARVNYLVGRDPARWHPDIPTFGRVRYTGLYRGIDAVFYGNERRLEYDLIVAPGADPSRIAFRVSGVDGIGLDGEGNLILRVGDQTVVHHAPVIYQEGQAGRELVAGRYVLQGRNRVAFRVGPYDRSRPLVIDPVISYATFLGGSGVDGGVAIAVDSSGNAYVTGQASSGFPTTSAISASGEIFVTKLNSAGTAIVYSTIIGGASSMDEVTAIAVDSTGSAYITGRTLSTDFPVVNAFQPTKAEPLGGFDGFITKLNAAGNGLVYSSYIGGGSNHGDQRGWAIAVDAAGHAYVGGTTASPFFPTTAGAFQTTKPAGSSITGDDSGWVAKVHPSGTSLVYSTYLGGTGASTVQGLAIDSAGNAYVGGATQSPDFPTTAGALKPSPGSGTNLDGFVAKLTPTGAALVFSTLLGGSGGEYVFALAVKDGEAHVTGYTDSTDFPTVNAFQATLKGSIDAYVARLNATGTALIYSTYLGGSASSAPHLDRGLSIAVDGTGSAIVGGQTSSSDFPVMSPVSLGAPSPISGFLTKLSPTGALTASEFSTRVGDIVEGVAVDASGAVYATGGTSGAFTATAGAYQTTPGGAGDAFVVKLTSAGGGGDTTKPSVTITNPPNGSWTGNSIQVSVSASDNVGVAKIDVWAKGGIIFTVQCGGAANCAGGQWWSTGPLPAGAYEVQAVATDTSGNQATSFKVTIYKDKTTPVYPSGAPTGGGGGMLPPLTAKLTTPTNGATVTGNVTVTMTTTGNQVPTSFLLKVDNTNTLFSGQVSSSTVTHTWSTTGYGNGLHTLNFTVTDGAGRTATDQITVNVQNGGGGGGGGDTTPPTVSITSPSSGVWTGNSIEVKASATDNVKLFKIELWGNGGIFGTISCATATCSGGTWWNTGPLAPGAYEVQAVATDAAGNTKTSAKIVIYKDATSPVKPSGAPAGGGGGTPPPLAAFFSSPANGATLTGTAEIAMGANNAQGSPTQFVLELDNASTLSTQSVSGSAATFMWNTSAASNGPHTLNLTVTDSAGRTATAVVNVTVSNSTGGGGDTTPPSVTITSPSNGAWTGNSIDVTATAADNVGLATLKFYGNGVQFAQVACDNATACSGTEWWSTGSLSGGQHTITVVATDTAGNQKTSAPVVINK